MGRGRGRGRGARGGEGSGDSGNRAGGGEGGSWLPPAILPPRGGGGNCSYWTGTPAPSGKGGRWGCGGRARPGITGEVPPLRSGFAEAQVGWGEPGCLVRFSALFWVVRPSHLQGIPSTVTSFTGPGGQGRGGPKDARPRRAEGKVLDIPRANQEGQGQSFYSISQPPRPPTLPSLPPTRDLSAPQERLAQKPSPSPRPRSAHPISAVVSPEPCPSGPQRPRGLLEVGRRTEIPGKTPSHQRPRENVPDFQESGSPTAQPKTPASLP